MVKAGRVYLKIAALVLDEQYGEMKKTQRERLLLRGDYDELETKYVHGHDSISEAVISLRKSLFEESISLPRGFTDYVKYGRELRTANNGFSMGTLKVDVADLSEERQAEIAFLALKDIHNRWVRGNTEAYFDAGRFSQRYLLMPVEMIGFSEMKKNLVFLEPIMREIGMSVFEDGLKDIYVEEVVKFRNAHSTNSASELVDWLMNGVNGYWSLDESVKRHLEHSYSSAVEIAGEIVKALRRDGFIFN